MVRTDIASFFSLETGDVFLHPETEQRMLVIAHATAEIEQDDGIKCSAFFLRVELDADQEEATSR